VTGVQTCALPISERVARTNVLASLPLLVVGLGLTTWVVTHL
jgi:hypothetical protein